jgi:hypothetical protein
MGFAGNEGSVVTEDILQQILDKNDDEEGGTGDADQRAVWNQRLGQSYENIMNYQPRTMTEDQRRANTKAYYQEVQDMAGPSPYEAQAARIAEQEKQQAGELRQQRGLSAIATIPAILEGGNAVRGLGAGAGKFGDMYGKALQADRAEKRALMSAKNNLEDAQYKMRVGLVGEARQLTEAGRRDKQAADAAHIAKNKALGEVAAKAVKLNAPAKAAPRNFDIENRDYRAEVLKATTPMLKDETPEQYDKRLKSIAAMEIYVAKGTKDVTTKSDVTSNVNSTSTQLQEKGPGSLTTSAESTESAEMLAGVKAFEDLNKSYNKNSRAIVKQFMDANGGDFAAAAQAYARTRVTPKAATSGDGKSAAPKAAPKPVLPAGSTTGKLVPGKGYEVFVNGKLVGYAK